MNDAAQSRLDGDCFEELLIPGAQENILRLDPSIALPLLPDEKIKLVPDDRIRRVELPRGSTD